MRGERAANGAVTIGISIAAWPVLRRAIEALAVDLPRVVQAARRADAFVECLRIRR
jgi:hypothetical protein